MINKNSSVSQKRNIRFKPKRQIFILFISILVLFLIQGVLRPGSVTLGQTMNITRQSSALGIVVLGQALVILAGGIDLSVGSVVTLTNVFAVSIMRGQDKNFIPAVFVCLAMGITCGVINGVGVIKLKIAPFIMTLCTMSILQGVCLVYTKGSPSGNVSPVLKKLGNGFIFEVFPYSTIIWIFLALAVWLALSRTTFGRKIYAVGGNASAARLSGINADAIKFSTYILSSTLAAVAGMVASGYIGTTSLTLGSDYITNSLAAVLIGGNAIEGGKGGVWGVVLGTFFMMLLFAILTMINIGEVGKLIIQGVIIFSVVAGQGLLKNRKELMA